MLAPFLPARRHQPLFMIDLAMPHDSDPAVQEDAFICTTSIRSRVRLGELWRSVNKNRKNVIS
jgi:hypothetical protein